MPDPTAPAVAPDVAELTNPQIARRLYEFTLERGDYEKNHDEVTHEFVDFVEDNLPTQSQTPPPRSPASARRWRSCKNAKRAFCAPCGASPITRTHAIASRR